MWKSGPWKTCRVIAISLMSSQLCLRTVMSLKYCSGGYLSTAVLCLLFLAQWMIIKWSRVICSWHHYCNITHTIFFLFLNTFVACALEGMRSFLSRTLCQCCFISLWGLNVLPQVWFTSQINGEDKVQAVLLIIAADSSAPPVLHISLLSCMKCFLHRSKWQKPTAYE